MKQAATSASRAPRVCLALATAFLALALVFLFPIARADAGQMAAGDGFSILSEHVGASGTATSSAVGVQAGEAAAPHAASVAVPQASMVFELRGSSPYEYPTFTFTLKAVKGSYPMPSAASGSSMSCTLEGAGTVDFGSIEFSKPGTYSYKIVQAAGKDPDWRYDTTVFRLKIVVLEGEDGLSARQSLTRGSSEEAVDSILFTNVYDPEAAQAASKLPSPEESAIGPVEDTGASAAASQGARDSDDAEKAGDAAEEEQVAAGAGDADAEADGDADTDEDADADAEADGDAGADAGRLEDAAAGGQARVQEAQDDAGQEPGMRPAADTLDPVEAPAVKQGFEPGAENPSLTAAIVAAAVVVVAIGGTAGMTWARTRRGPAHG